ncbi:MAG: ABC transporter permease subunit [Cyanobacterium sp. T60_A2020_053]|nr:ABC transporter permease subunit [Cyanobacterium sp. T60_A2020_053]
MTSIINNTLAILQKELQSYFNSPLALIIAGIFWLISGIFFVFILFSPQGIIQSVALQEQIGNSVPIDIPYEFIQIYFGVMGSISLFLLPMLSMGLYTEERKKGTLELLATSPLFNWVVALGKLLGVWLFFLTMIMPILVYEIIIFSSSAPSFPPQVPLLAHGGLLLLAGAILSLGMFISSLTESTIFSAIITFILVLFLSILDTLANNLGGNLGEIISHFSILTTYDNFVRGIFDTGSLIIFISYIFLGLFLTAQSIETLRYTKN